ncbi:hypothetical protein QQP08_015995 [Theobroma cacao]|nr:hypothetical protein QQP08_015995 [Theobroma cacao]
MASNAINTRVLASKNALADQRNGRVGFDWSIIKILQICPNHTYADAKSCLYNRQHTCFVILKGLTMLLLVLFPSIPPLFFEAFNFRPLIAMEKAVDFLWNEEALLLLAKQ